MFLILVILAGAVIGLLINYFADVLPATRRFSLPVCPNCSQPYALREYLLCSRCSSCGSKRCVRVFLVLAGAIAASILVYHFPWANLGFWATAPLLIFLCVIFVIDIEHRLVLIETTLFGLVICSIYGFILHGGVTTLLGGLGGGLIMLGFYLFGIVFTKVMERIKHQKINEVAFGFGDVCAGLFLGLLAGWPVIAGAIIVAVLIFGGVSFLFLLFLLVSKRYRAFARALPFAPALIFGVVVMFYL